MTAEAKVVPVAAEAKSALVASEAKVEPAPAVSGPVPSATIEDRAAAPDADPDHSTTLPRRVPRREAPVTGGKTPLVPAPRTGTPPAEDTSRPLRRRVRGATLRTTAGAAQVLPQEARERDAEAVRSALEEFEAAVERAQRDSDTGNFARPGNEAGPAGASRTTNPPQDQNHLPEGAEQ
jgi:hypothetical protein